MITSWVCHRSSHRLALLAALASVALVAQEPHAPAVLVVRAPLDETPDQESRLAEVTHDLFPAHRIHTLPGIGGPRGGGLGLSFADAFDIARGSHFALQTVRDRECHDTTDVRCGTDLPARAKRVLDRYDELANQTLTALATILRESGQADVPPAIAFVSNGLPFRVEPRRGFEAVRRAARESGATLIVVDAYSEGRGTAGLTRLADIARGDRFGVSPDDRVRLRTRLAVHATAPTNRQMQPADAASPLPATSPVTASLKVAMEHAVTFAERGASILADEHTVQQAKVRPSAASMSPGSNAGITTERRVLDSEVALVHVGNRDLWLLARDVLRVDGKEVPDADRIRLPSAHPSSTPDALRRFERVAQQGARFNIGGVERNVNTPTLALWLLTSAVSPRLDFRDAGTARVDGRVCHVIAFRERRAPYLFVVAGQPTPVSGRLWVDRERAAVVKTELSLPGDVIESPPSSATVTVTYGLDPVLSAWVPRTMSERYDDFATRQFVLADSAYANYRMFRVAARIIK